MKLSEKGRRKAFVVGELLDDPDFVQSDFEDAVVLTIEDAKILNRLIERIDDDIVLTGTETVSWMTLQLKIRQVEKHE